MKARLCLFGCLLLAACDPQEALETAGPVVVTFAQPFPTTAPDLLGFLPRHRRPYTTPGDTSVQLVLGEKVLIQQTAQLANVSGPALDTLQLPRRPGTYRGADGRRYRVQALAADSFRLRFTTLDTLLNLAGPHPPRLRYYRGAYYTSRPAVLDSTTWSVRRLVISHGRLTQEVFNPDSLRVQALAPGTVRQRHAYGQLRITLAPQSRQAIRQVSDYAGLWLAMAYRSQPEQVSDSPQP